MYLFHYITYSALGISKLGFLYVKIVTVLYEFCPLPVLFDFYHSSRISCSCVQKISQIVALFELFVNAALSKPILFPTSNVFKGILCNFFSLVAVKRSEWLHTKHKNLFHQSEVRYWLTVGFSAESLGIAV